MLFFSLFPPSRLLRKINLLDICMFLDLAQIM